MNMTNGAEIRNGRNEMVGTLGIRAILEMDASVARSVVVRSVVEEV